MIHAKSNNILNFTSSKLKQGTWGTPRLTPWTFQIQNTNRRSVLTWLQHWWFHFSFIWFAVSFMSFQCIVSMSVVTGKLFVVSHFVCIHCWYNYRLDKYPWKHFLWLRSKFSDGLCFLSLGPLQTALDPELHHSFVHSFIRSFVHSFIHSFIHSLIHSFILFVHTELCRDRIHRRKLPRHSYKAFTR